MKKRDINIYKILLKNKRVNNYTKLLLTLNTLDFYNDYYIPNKKLMLLLNIDKRRIKRLLLQLKEDNIIYIVYKGRKRYFGFKILNDKSMYEEEKQEFNEYNWLDEE